MRLQIDDIEMAYEDRGTGLPVLFIHGFPLSRKIWKPQLDSLSDVARIIAPDLRGHGESSASAGEYSMDLLADDCMKLLNTLHIDRKVVICGLSMGGYIEFAFYRKYAYRIAGLILTATRASADTPEGKANRDKAILKAQNQGIQGIIEDMLPKLLSPETLATNQALVSQVREIMQPTSLDGLIGCLMGMKNRPDSNDLLPKINLPTLLVFGDEDQIIPVDEAKAMQKAIPNARLEIIPGAGHLLNLEQPDQFNAILRDFLTKDIKQ